MSTEDDVLALVDGFEDTTLPTERYTHAAHLWVALVFVRRYGLEGARARVPAAIRRYNAATGRAPSAYHETITQAWLAIVARFLRDDDSGQSLGVLADALVAKCGDKHHLAAYYSPDVLMSEEARAGFVPPDRTPLEAVDVSASRRPRRRRCTMNGHGARPEASVADRAGAPSTLGVPRRLDRDGHR
jgi:hypothetical protein